MLSFFRGLTKSRFGIVIVFGLLVLIALAFALGDVTGLNSGATGGKGAVLARVGNREITEGELRDRLNFALSNARQRGQTITMEEFLRQGALEGLLDEMIDVAAMEEFANQSGIKVSRRTIDGQIAGTPAFQGPDGKFDQKLYEDLLKRQRISEELIRKDLASETYRRWLLAPLMIANQVPLEIAVPYASLLLERRKGQIVLIPSQAMDPGAPPSDQELAKYFDRNKARYTVPERRIVRYARVSADMVAARATPSEAEIAAAYKAAGSRFAAAEKRSIRQVVVADQNLANQIAQKVRGGATIADAARAAGLEATSLDGVTKADFARTTAQPVADAAFAAAPNSLVGPVKSNLGFHVLRVENIATIPAKSLEQARGELASELTATKTVEALRALYNKIDDGIGDGSTFDELVKDANVTAQATPALLPNGANPDDPQTAPNPELQPILKAAFAMEQGDEPQLVPLGEAPQAGFALVKVERVVPATPRPLKDIKEAVLRDYRIDKAVQMARTAASAVVAALEKGTPMAQALAAANAKAPPPTAIDTTRGELNSSGRQIPAPIALMFQMAAKKAKLLEAPQRAGYFVVYLDAIEQHDARGNTAAVEQARNVLRSSVGREYAEQFAAAVRDHLKVTRDEKEIARLRADLLKQGR